MSQPCMMHRAVVTCIVFFALQCGGDRTGFEGSSPRPPFDAPSPGDSGCAASTLCSRDLRAVLDACSPTERVLTECAADSGCKDGRCVPACEATGAADSVGCEFRAVAPEGEVTEACFAVFVSNTWSTTARLELSFAGQSLDVARAARVVGPPSATRPITYLPMQDELAPGQTAILFLAEGPRPSSTATKFFVSCPEGVTAAVTTPLGVGGTGRRQSFDLRSSVPVTAYSIYPYGGGRSAVASSTLLLPVRTWGTDYLVVSPWERLLGTAEVRLSPGLQVVAAEDATTVTVHASADVAPRAGVHGVPAGTSASYTLAAGEVLQLVQQVELDGSLISADKPVGYWATHECMNVPSNRTACDMSSTQLPPTKAWGTRYAAALPPSRGAAEAEVMPWRIAAARNGTRLTYRPYRPTDAPETLDGGRIVVFSSSDPFVVESQDIEHPIALYGYMSGGSATTREIGDPEFVPVVPTDQYLDRYVFLVDPTYAESAITVVRTAKEGVFPEVTLDCLGAIPGFRPIDENHEISTVRFYGNRAQNGCGVGRHEISANGAFAITVWGVDYYSSYGYPGGMGLRPLNTVHPEIR